jgi:anaerobic ribonucleoside-triphosphate reductase
MKREYDTCRNCGVELEGQRQIARGICGSCDRSEVTK